MNAPAEKSDYLLLFRGTDWHRGLSPEEIQKTMTVWMAWFNRLIAEGRCKGGQSLAPETRVISGKAKNVSDGPYAEAKESVAGYFLLHVTGFDEAVEIAKECPTLGYGTTVEIAPVDGTLQSQRTCCRDARDRRGRDTMRAVGHSRDLRDSLAKFAGGLSLRSSDRVSAPTSASAVPGAAEVPRLAEHLFRHEAGRLVSVLTGIFGIDRLQMAEDVVQEALIRAMQVWPYQGIPQNPAAWLTQTAKHLALDFVRREKRFHEKQPEIIAVIESAPAPAADAFLLESEIHDERLRLMFTCCHPLIPAESQAALALKTLCGFGTNEIAHAFLTTEAAVAKRLTRARQKIQELKIPFGIPAGPELGERLDSVRQTLLLLFNEGYKASTGETLIREDLCAEAIRLATLLAEHPAGSQPRTHALLALMLLNAARLPARVDSDGNILRLQEQDRARWDRAMIACGMWHLAQSAAGDELSEYHLQAGIAACHDTAADYESTDWPQILALYDCLVQLDASPVIALNRKRWPWPMSTGRREGFAAVACDGWPGGTRVVLPALCRAR